MYCLPPILELDPASLMQGPSVVQYRERIIFLSKPVDDELGNQLVATMLYLSSENPKDLNLYINCSGGEVRCKC